MKNFIRTLSVLLAVLTLVSASAVFSSFALDSEDYYLDHTALFGDADSDRRLSVKDATAVQKHLAKISILERKQLMAADVDANGKVTISDAADIQKYLANLIPSFEADPAIPYKIGDGKINMTFEDLGSKKVAVYITEEGGYTFEIKRKEACMVNTALYDENMNYITSGDVYGNSERISLFLTPGRYIFMVDAYFVDNVDTYKFSAVKNNSVLPFDISAAEDIKAGDVINVSKDEGDKVFKLDYDPGLDFGSLISLKANAEVDFTVLNSYLAIENGGDFNKNTSVSSVNVNFDDYSDGIIDDKVKYIYVSQSAEKSDFTLSCFTYVDSILAECSEATLDEATQFEITKIEYKEGSMYEGNYLAKFTPEKDGFYKVEANFDDEVRFGSDYSYSYLPEIRKFNFFEEVEGKLISVEELKAGNTYIIWLYGYKEEEINNMTVNLTESSEDEYNAFREAFNKRFESGSVDFECDEIALGEEVFVSLKSMEELEDNYFSDTKTFKFTADEDMTIVAYSKDSENASVSVYDEEGHYASWHEDSGNFTRDFTVCVSLKKGESCYFSIESSEYYGDAFYFSVVDINDYESLI